MMTSQITSSFHNSQNSNVEVPKISKIDGNSLGRIFSFLPHSDASSIPVVNKFFCFISLKPNVAQDFEFLVKKGEIHWSQVWKFSFLSSFLENIIKYEFNDPNFREIENPNLKNLYRYPNLVMLHPRIKYGNYNFSICNNTDIKVQERGIKEFKILAGEQDKILCSLVAENNYVFSYRTDAKIIQWDYLTGQRIKTINTNFPEPKDSNVNEWGYHAVPRINSNFLPEPPLTGITDFTIKNGVLGIRSKSEVNMVNLIFYETSKILTLQNIASYGDEKNVLTNKHFFLNNTRDVTIIDYTENAITCRVISPSIGRDWGEFIKIIISNEKFLTDSRLFISKTAVDKNLMCIQTSNTNVHIVDHWTGFVKKSCKFKYLDVLAFSDNLVFGYYSYTNQIDILNLNTEKVFSKIDNVFVNGDLNPNLIEQLFLITRENRSKLDLSVCSIM